MPKSIDSTTLAALRDRRGFRRVNFVTIVVKDDEGDPVQFGFTDFGMDITLDVISGTTGGVVSRSFFGDHSPITSIDPIPMKIGISIDSTQIILNPLHESVELMLRGHDCRNAAVEIHRGVFTFNDVPVAQPRLRRIGQINKAPVETAGVGGESRLVLSVVSQTRELTRTNPARWSDEAQRLRSGDRMFRYSAIADEVPFWWGEKSST